MQTVSTYRGYGQTEVRHGLAPTFAAQLREHSASASSIARVLGYHRTTVHRWLMGKNEPRDLVQRMALGALKVSLKPRKPVEPDGVHNTPHPRSCACARCNAARNAKNPDSAALGVRP